MLEKKNVVYQVNCENCNSKYIGQTTRQLGTRMDEQMRDCLKAKDKGFVRDNPKNDTGLPKHALSNNHSFDVQNPKILHEEKCTANRKRLEGMYIHLTPDTCNSYKGVPPWILSGTVYSVFSEIIPTKLHNNNNNHESEEFLFVPACDVFCFAFFSLTLICFESELDKGRNTETLLSYD